MSIIGSNILAGAAGSGVSAYEIEQSLRFNQAFLSRTPSSAGNRRTFTFSVWLKRMNSGRDGFFGAWSSNTSRDAFRFDTSDEFRIFFNETTSGDIFSNARHRDISAWYHFVVAVDTTQATAADRVKVWTNGELVSFRSASYPAQNTDLNVNNTVAHYVGHSDSQTSQEWQGYLAEFHHVDGTALDHEDFGEFDNNGVWRPIRYTGSYGTNGFYLKFDPSATNGIGHDHSGNGNNFTASGFTTSGTGTDVMSDTPTTNWCTLNPLDKYNNSAVVAQNGNLEFAQGGAAWWAMRASFGMTSGKWYWEVKNKSGLYQAPGLGNSDADLNGYASEPDTWLYVNTGQLNTDGTLNSAASWGGNSHTTNDIVGVAFDADNGKLWFSKNGTWQGDASPDPATDTDPAVTGLTSGPYFPYFVQYQTTTEVNFGQRAFEYTPPTGFKALNTSNLPAPTIKDGSEYFQTVLYTGNGADRNIDVTDNSDNNWQPDLVWIKQRSGSATDHRLFDQVRGGGAVIRSNNTNAEQTASDDGIYFAYADGFNIDYGTNGANYNGSGQTYVAWNWLAGNGTSSNTDGSITSTVSANASAGFSIVSYTGVAGDNISATVGHGLGVAPDLIIIKNRDWASSGAAWQTYHSALPSTGTSPVRLSQSLSLDTTSAASGNDFKDQMNNTLPTSTVFSVSSHDGVSAANRYRTYGRADDYIAYCFAEVEGYSKFGSYTGNNSSDGPFVYCGFKPRWIMRKATGDTSNWVILDTARDTYNETDNMLLPNTSGTESDGSDIDILSNGFKMRSAALNGSTPYIFAAFAENPFGGSGVSPATAR